MSTRRHRSFRHPRRSGISSLIGAIFFVLVAFLVFSSTVLIFETFSGYAGTFKQVNSADIQAKNTIASVPNLTFGGLIPTSTLLSNKSEVNSGAVVQPLLPVTNMNFTDNMNGWTFSREYQLALHDGVVTNYPANVLPGVDVFVLNVTNSDPAGVGSSIEQVQIDVNPNFDVPASLLVPHPPAGWTVTVNPPPAPGAPAEIIWTANQCDGPMTTGILSSTIAVPAKNIWKTFAWAAVVPPTVGVPFASVVAVTWENVVAGSCVLPPQPANTRIGTEVVTTNAGGLSTGTIVAEPVSTVAGGATGGYDATSNSIGSESGPGSVFLDYQPSFNGNPITAPNQLTATMNFTTYFTLNNATTLASSCCTFSYGYSIDKDVSSSIVSLDAFLELVQAQVPGCTPQHPVEELAANPSILGTGWQMYDQTFNPSATLETSPGGPLCAGLYALVVSVDASMIGPTAQTANYPAVLMMHFDDIGLALQQSATSYYADSSIPLAIGTTQLIPSEVQSIRFSAQLAQGSTGNNVTAYAFLEDIGTSTNASAPDECHLLVTAFCNPSWVELGQVTFTSSATISDNIPASTAPEFIDQYNSVCDPGSPALSTMCVRIYAVSGTNFLNLAANISVVVQTWQERQGSLMLYNNGTEPIHFVSLYVSGPDGVQSNTEIGSVTTGTTTGGTTSTTLVDSSATWTPNQWVGYYLYYTSGPAAGQAMVITANTATTITTAAFSPVPGNSGDSFEINGAGIWVGAGEAVAVPLGTQTPTQLYPFTWVPGQTYVVTATTDKGLVLTSTFISP